MQRDWCCVYTTPNIWKKRIPSQTLLKRDSYAKYAFELWKQIHVQHLEELSHVCFCFKHGLEIIKNKIQLSVLCCHFHQFQLNHTCLAVWERKVFTSFPYPHFVIWSWLFLFGCFFGFFFPPTKSILFKKTLYVKPLNSPPGDRHQHLYRWNRSKRSHIINLFRLGKIFVNFQEPTSAQVFILFFFRRLHFLEQF